MLIDSSVLVAILLGEPDREQFLRAVDAADVRLVSAMTKLETGIVAIGRIGTAVVPEIDLLLAKIAATVVPFDEQQADLAREAFVRFGRGRHKAGLNFGDCAAYALAVLEAEPLLFKGTDFGATDVEVVALGEGA